jgi:4-alpha-glucanotransferase
VVPDFVRASLSRLGVPGYRIFRWEREWAQPERPFKEPSEYPAVSVAASGTHDTEPQATWWETASEEERLSVARLASVKALSSNVDVAHAPFVPQVRDVLLETLFASGSNTLLLPIQDVFGWTDRINTPGTVTPDNWTFRLPWLVDELERSVEAVEGQARLRRWVLKYER